MKVCSWEENPSTVLPKMFKFSRTNMLVKTLLNSQVRVVWKPHGGSIKTCPNFDHLSPRRHFRFRPLEMFWQNKCSILAFALTLNIIQVEYKSNLFCPFYTGASLTILLLRVLYCCHHKLYKQVHVST